MGTSLDLYNLAAEYLAGVVTALADTPAGPPTVQYVSPGVPALNCDQVVVWVGGPLVAPTSISGGVLSPDHRVAIAQVDYIRLTAVVARCCESMVNDGSDVDAATHNADALQVNADVWAVWNLVAEQFRAGTIFQLPQCREFAFDPAISLAVEGGICGWQIPMHIQLGGYRLGEST